MRTKVKQEAAVECVSVRDNAATNGLYYMSVTKYHLRNPTLRKRWPVSDHDFDFDYGEPQPTAARAKADAKSKAKLFANWFPGAKVIADGELSGPFTMKVVDQRKRTFAEFGVVEEDYRNETIH
jgi:hypothetical protein